ncbi:hypothetical protein D3C86_1137160 [compost metagenome]
MLDGLQRNMAILAPFHSIGRVGDDVDEHLLQSHRAGFHRKLHRPEINIQHRIGGLQPRTDNFERIPKHRLQTHRCHFFVGLAGEIPEMLADRRHAVDKA